jgi:hypothetical protein
MLRGLAHGTPRPDGHPSPGYAEYLEDAALGRTRLGDSVRRSGEHGAPMLCRPGPSGSMDDGPSALMRSIGESLDGILRDIEAVAGGDG